MPLEHDHAIDGCNRTNPSVEPDPGDPLALHHASMPGAMRDRETGRATGEALAALVGTESRYQPPRSAGRSPHGGSVRDRLRLRGAATLTTPDLLVALLGNGSERAVEALMRRHGAEGLSQLKERDITEARFSDGAACRLAALLEFHRRLRAMQTERRPRISKPSEAYDQVHGIASARKEHLVGLYLDAQNGLLHSETISIGSLNTTRTHPREILYPAIQNLALGFILAHNHPSGNPEPSPEDVEFTRSVRRAGELMGIELYDHIIVTPGGYTSLRERGLIN